MVGLLIRERRLARGWSQEELAGELGTSQRQITRWESYTRQLPRSQWRDAIGDVLGITQAEWHSAAAEAEESERSTSMADQLRAEHLAQGPHPDTPPWYVTASDEELMERAGITIAPPQLAAYVEGLSLHAGERGSPVPDGLEDTFGRLLKYETKRGDPIRWFRVFGTCMEPRINDGDWVYIDRDLPIEPGKFVAAVLYGEQAVARRLAKVKGRFWLETLDGAPPTLVTDGIRIIGRLRHRQSSFD